MTEPNHESRKIRDFYNNVYYDKSVALPATTRHLRRLAEKIDIGPNENVLDIACGTGEWLLAVQQRGATIVGLDISHKAISTCRSALPDDALYVGSAEELPFKDDQFDVVSCLGSLEHFVNPSTALSEIGRVGKPDGRFLLLVPNADFLTLRLGLYDGTNQADAKEDLRTLAEWESLFADAGLDVTRCWRDLHVLSWKWINLGPWYTLPVRILQAVMLLFLPLTWQYQVYYLCQRQE